MLKIKLIIHLASFACLIITSCSLRPLAYEADTTPIFEGKLQLNEQLTASKKINIGEWFGPEDILLDSLGNLYTGVHNNDFTDGRILKIDTTGKTIEFYNSNAWVAGLHFDSAQNLIALSHRQGLISISPSRQVKILATTDENGKPFLIPNGLDIADNGMIYFTNTSECSAYSLKYGRKMILEMKPLGGLYSYNPTTKQIKTLIAGTYFGNGVVISKDQNYLLMVETTKYRIIKYWLLGSKAGQTEIFIENLPGFPNGISVRENGSYWLGFTTKRNEVLDKVHTKPSLKKLIYSLPEFLQPKAAAFGMVMNISKEGEILSSLFDTKGTVIPEAGSVKEFKGNLYIGGDVLPYVGKYKLTTANY